MWDETVGSAERDGFERLLAASSLATGVDMGTPEKLPAGRLRRLAARMGEQASIRYAIGIELLPFRMVGVVVDENGERLADDQLVLDDMDVTTVVSGAAALTSALMDLVPYVRAADERVALGFQQGGPVDVDSGTVLFYHKAPPDPPGPVQGIDWPDSQPLGRLLSQATGLPTVLGNDADAYAVYEMWFGAGRELSRFAIVLLREGVGSSLVVGNRLFDGPMELGHLSVLSDGKRQCDCGIVGCLETTGGIHGILESVHHYTQESLADVVAAARLAERPDTAHAVEAFKRAGHANAKGIGVIVDIARPQRVVVYVPPVLADPAFRAAGAFRAEVETFRSYCHKVYAAGCELVIQPLRPYDGAHGAALAALERRFGIVAPAAAAGAAEGRQR
ncbi:MAG TPA: ROK family protein [Streptosporangiaceae bacterium]